MGHDFVEQLEMALSQVDFVAILLSPQFLLGPWAQREYRSALERESREGRVVILPVLLEDCSVPPLLRTKHYADLRSSFVAGVKKLLHSIGKTELPLRRDEGAGGSDSS